MLIHHDPDEFETVYHHSTCYFHQNNPGVAHPGCTCGSSAGYRRRPPEDVARIKAEKRRREEDKILAEAECIKRQRGEA